MSLSITAAWQAGTSSRLFFLPLTHAHSHTSSGDRWRVTAGTVPPAPQGKPRASPLATLTLSLPCSPPPPSPGLLWGGYVPFILYESWLFSSRIICCHDGKNVCDKKRGISLSRRQVFRDNGSSGKRGTGVRRALQLSQSFQMILGCWMGDYIFILWKPLIESTPGSTLIKTIQGDKKEHHR